jgi:hypothetical protein
LIDGIEKIAATNLEFRKSIDFGFLGVKYTNLDEIRNLDPIEIHGLPKVWCQRRDKRGESKRDERDERDKRNERKQGDERDERDKRIVRKQSDEGTIGTRARGTRRKGEMRGHRETRTRSDKKIRFITKLRKNSKSLPNKSKFKKTQNFQRRVYHVQQKFGSGVTRTESIFFWPL